MALSLRRPVTVLIVATILFFMPSCCLSEQAPKYSFLKDATKAPPVSYYDYIIVGGGTAGCPLAATLSQSFRVLLLERGGSPYGNKNVSDIAHFADTLADVSPSSPSQLFVSEDGVILTRARILGGASCLNAGFYSHAGPDYAAAAGWDGALANESYRWVERTVAFEPEMKGWQSAFRDGLLEAGVTPYNGFTYDHLRGTKVGGTIFDKDGNRHTAADLLQHADPRRLTVLLHGTAMKILFRHKGRARAVAHGVVFRDSKGVKHKAYLYGRSKNNEIIVSSGAMGSPQLLMLSGVGPRRQLESLGIPVVLDQPWVGQGMSDNPMNAVFVPSPVPVEDSLIQVVGITSYGGFIEGASGSFFSKFTPNSSSSSSSDEKPSMLRGLGMFSPQTGQLSTVPPKQRTPEAIASAVEAMNKLSEKSLLQGSFIIEKIMGPLSTGHLELRSRNPDDTPSVTFNYFKEAEDLRRCVQGMKTIEKVVQSKAFSAFKYPDMSNEALLNLTLSFPVNFLPRHNNDLTSMEQFCKDTVMTIWHYHGGCHVGKVVDRDLKVLGVDQLRVVDSSTFKFSPGTNPQATVMMLGRYMGVKMLDERLAS